MKEFLNINELSEWLGIKKSTLYLKVSSSQIPHYKIDRLVRFKKSEIDDWIKSFRKKSLHFDGIIKKCIEESNNSLYNSPHRETRAKSLKGGRYGAF